MAFTILYVWEDLDASRANDEPEQKFGDHFSHADTLEDAKAETIRYIRGTLGRQKHKFDEGRVVVHQLWDASEYAQGKNRFGVHQKVDDVVRPVIGHHVQADVHRIDADTLIERVNRELSRNGQPLPSAGLSKNQYDAAVNVLESLEAGRRTIVAELCARFGKTIWSGSIIRETEASLTIIATYVKTVMASFKKDLTSFEQFKDFVIVDTQDEDYETQVSDALDQGKQVVTLLSMCNGSRRQSRIDFLFGQSVDKLLIIDEADFGVHQRGQSQPLIDAVDDMTATIIMTGTNADKAASIWNVDHYLNVTYPELIMEKRKTAELATLDK